MDIVQKIDFDFQIISKFVANTIRIRKTFLLFVGSSFFCLLVNSTMASEMGPKSWGAYISSGLSTGKYNGDSWRNYSFDGATIIPLNSKLNFQFNGRFRDYSIGDDVAYWGTAGQQNAIGVTTFWRDPSFGLLGIFYDSGIVEAWQSDFISEGVHAEAFINDQITLGSRYTRTNNKTDLNSGVTSTDNAIEFWATYFPTYDLAINANYVYHSTDHVSASDSDESVYGISAEYFFKNLIQTNTSITVSYSHSIFSDYENHLSDKIGVTMKWYFIDQKNLISVKRTGPIENRYNYYLDKPLWWDFPI